MSDDVRLHGIGLDAAQVRDLASTRHYDAALIDADLSFILIGVDRLRGGAHEALPSLDPTLVIGHLAWRFDGVSFLAASSVEVEHPYNLARRAASLDHLASGRSGIVLADTDRYLARDPSTLPGFPAHPTTEAADDVSVTADAVIAIQRIWQTWPQDAVVADIDAGRFVAIETLRRADHHGYFAIDGPGTLPRTRQIAPIIGWYATTERELAEARGSVDLIIAPPDLLRRSPGSGAARAVEFVEAVIDLTPDAPCDPLRDASAAAFEVFPGAELGDIAAYLATRRPRRGGSAPAPRQTLRERLGIGPPAELLHEAPLAFPTSDADTPAAAARASR